MQFVQTFCLAKQLTCNTTPTYFVLKDVMRVFSNVSALASFRLHHSDFPAVAAPVTARLCPAPVTPPAPKPELTGPIAMSAEPPAYPSLASPSCVTEALDDSYIGSWLFEDASGGPREPNECLIRIGDKIVCCPAIVKPTNPGALTCPLSRSRTPPKHI